MHKENDTWPFADPPNVATITTRQITSKQQPILLVFHDEEDGSWQFLTGEAFNVDDAMIVGLQTIVQLDSTVSELADLPLGWQASRAKSNDSWTRSQTACSNT